MVHGRVWNARPARCQSPARNTPVRAELRAEPEPAFVARSGILEPRQAPSTST
jgi:hypothetical protein